MVCPKFITEKINGEVVLIIGKCEYHYQLATNTKNVLGGGWFRFKDNAYYFSDDSHDFGKFEEKDIRLAIESNNVYTKKLLVGAKEYSVASQYKFYIQERESNKIIALN